MIGDIILALLEIGIDVATEAAFDSKEKQDVVRVSTKSLHKDEYYNNPKYFKSKNWDNAVATNRLYEGKIETVDSNGKKVIDKSGASYNPNMIKGSGLTISKGGVSSNPVHKAESLKPMTKSKVITKPNDKVSYNPNMVTGNSISISKSGVSNKEVEKWRELIIQSK